MKNAAVPAQSATAAEMPMTGRKSRMAAKDNSCWKRSAAVAEGGAGVR